MSIKSRIIRHAIEALLLIFSAKLFYPIMLKSWADKIDAEYIAPREPFRVILCYVIIFIAFFWRQIMKEFKIRKSILLIIDMMIAIYIVWFGYSYMVSNDTPISKVVVCLLIIIIGGAFRAKCEFKNQNLKSADEVRPCLLQSTELVLTNPSMVKPTSEKTNEPKKNETQKPSRRGQAEGPSRRG
jgi:hypothetical protein